MATGWATDMPSDRQLVHMGSWQRARQHNKQQHWHLERLDAESCKHSLPGSALYHICGQCMQPTWKCALLRQRASCVKRGPMTLWNSGGCVSSRISSSSPRNSTSFWLLVTGQYLSSALSTGSASLESFSTNCGGRQWRQHSRQCVCGGVWGGGGICGDAGVLLHQKAIASGDGDSSRHQRACSARRRGLVQSDAETGGLVLFDILTLQVGIKKYIV
jgi:hypothetical protein